MSNRPPEVFHEQLRRFYMRQSAHANHQLQTIAAVFAARVAPPALHVRCDHESSLACMATYGACGAEVATLLFQCDAKKATDIDDRNSAQTFEVHHVHTSFVNEPALSILPGRASWVCGG